MENILHYYLTTINLPRHPFSVQPGKKCDRTLHWSYTEGTHYIFIIIIILFAQVKQEAQLMLTNPCDTFRGKSRSPNIVSFHMLGILSSCASVTLTLRRAVFLTFDVKKCHDLEIGVKGHSRSLTVVLFDRLCIVSY